MRAVHRRSWSLVLALAVALVAALAPAASASASAQVREPLPPRPAAAPPMPTNIAPGLASDPAYRPSTEPHCRRGNLVCVDNMIREMQRNYDRLGCDHNAVFALLYLRTTEAIRDAIAGGGWLFGEPLFDDDRFLAHQAYVFGRYYLDALYAWERGQHDRVPEAWRIAFETAANEEVSVAGNMWLGINAHVSRDLPFVLDAIGITGPEGQSRKADHDRVNEVLARAGAYSRGAISAELAPMPTGAEMSLAQMSWLPQPPASIAPTDAVPRWRATAWDHATALTAGDLERTVVEDHASSIAEELHATTRYDLVFDDAEREAVVEARNAYCAANRS